MDDADRPAGRLAHDGDDLVEAAARPTRDVEHGPGLGVRADGGDRRVDHVVDERVRPDLGTVSVDRERFSGERTADQSLDCHVGSLPWPVHGEQAEARDGHAEVLGVGPGERFRSELGHAVRAERSGRRVLVDGAGDLAVDGGAGREHETLDRQILERVEQAVGRRHVVLEVGVERRPRGAHARLGGEVEHGVHVLDERPEVGRQQVGDDDLGVRLGLQPGDVGPLGGRVVVRRERVDAADRPTLCNQPLGQSTADETGSPGDECPHLTNLPGRALMGSGVRGVARAGEIIGAKVTIGVPVVLVTRVVHDRFIPLGGER